MFKDNISRHLANVEPNFNDGIDRPSTSQSTRTQITR